MNNFLQKYNEYKTRYLITEADQQQTTLIRFLVTINSVRKYTDNLISTLFDYKDMYGICVYDFNADKIAENCTISIPHISHHGVYGYILRTNFELIERLFNNNQQKFYDFCKQQNINPNKRLKHTLPPTTEYTISDVDIQGLINNIEQSLTYLSVIIPQVIIKMVGERYGIPFDEVGKCKVIVNDTITFGVFTEMLSPNHCSFDIGNIYPTLPRDYDTDYRYVYKIIV